MVFLLLLKTMFHINPLTMKKKSLLFIVALLGCTLYGQVNVQPVEKVQTGFLYDLSPGLSGIENYNGTENAKALNLYIWNQLYFEIAKSNLSQRHFESIQSIHQKAKENMESGVIPIGMLAFDYNRIRGNPADYLIDENTLDLKDARITEYTVFAAAAFRNEIYNGSQVTFSLSEDFIFSNFKNLPVNFRINFDDGSGWKKFSAGDEISASYNSIGQKTIAIQYNARGEIFNSFFKINVKRLVAPAPTATWLVQADQGYNGVTTSGDAFVLLSDQHTELTRPVVLSEGIDFEDNFGWDELYDLFNQQNMLEDLRAEGLDIVVLNFHQPLTYIQSNAFLFAKLLEMVNDSIGYSAPLQIVGPSMGGLVTRYALTYMEHNNLAHNANLYVSFETPHLGANMPLGLQYEIFFFKDLDPNVQLLLDILDEPAPRQMLVYHYTDPPSATAGSDALFDEFYNDIAAIGGYPDSLRKIALSNGRGDGIGQPYNAGDQVIDYNYSTFLATLKGNVWAVEDNTNGQIFEGLINSFLFPNQQLDVTVFSEQPYDNAPGGSRTTFADMDTIQAPLGDIIALHDNHCFIPTVSGLAIAGEDVFHNLTTDPQIMQKTPFDTIFWSTDNYDHTYISPETAQFAVSEIMSAQMQSHQIMLTAGWNDLSSYIDPTDKSIESIAAQLGDDLIILQHFGEVYWPGGGVSTIETWDYKKGYITKLTANRDLTVIGDEPEVKSVQIQQGWNLIPVLCKDCPTILSLLDENLEKVIIIREAVGVNIFWPEMGIYSLTHLEPGNSYYLYANEPFLLEFE